MSYQAHGIPNEVKRQRWKQITRSLIIKSDPISIVVMKKKIRLFDEQSIFMEVTTDTLGLIQFK